MITWIGVVEVLLAETGSGVFEPTTAVPVMAPGNCDGSTWACNGIVMSAPTGRSPRVQVTVPVPAL